MAGSLAESKKAERRKYGYYKTLCKKTCFTSRIKMGDCPRKG
jgi:hypothetical protein